MTIVETCVLGSLKLDFRLYNEEQEYLPQNVYKPYLENYSQRTSRVLISVNRKK